MVVVLGDVVQVLWLDARHDENGSKGVNDRYKLFKHRNSSEYVGEKH